MVDIIARLSISLYIFTEVSVRLCHHDRHGTGENHSIDATPSRRLSVKAIPSIDRWRYKLVQYVVDEYGCEVLGLVSR